MKLKKTNCLKSDDQRERLAIVCLINHNIKPIKMSKILKAGVLSVCIAMTGMSAMAQVSPYFVDFEIDSTKAYASTTPVLLNGKNWVMPGVYLGDMIPTSDKYNGLHAARVRRVDNTTGANGSITLNEDLTQGIGNVTFSHARYGSETGATLQLLYTIDGTNWVPVGGTITPGATLTPVTIPVNMASAKRIRIQKSDTSASRINVDDILISNFNNVATNVILVNKAPIGLNVPLTQNTLTLTFNENVALGTSGSIVLHPVGGTPLPFPVATATNLSVVGMTVTISNITLASNKDYYVTFDSTAIVKAGGTIKSTGIYNNNTWKFSTVDTSTPPNITTLNETFADCLDPNMGVFKHTSVTGTATWRCGTQGHTGNNSVYINGGFSGGANDNEDWLITRAPVDLAAANNPSLEFWLKTNYSGTTTKDVLISTNYTGTGNPGTATWQSIKDVSTETSATWKVYTNISLNAYKTTPFYLAFKYVSSSTSTGAQEWSLDDVKIKTGTTGIDEEKIGELGLSVLGNATSNQILLGLTLKSASKIDVSVYDITGRKVYDAKTAVQSGFNQYKIENISLNAGLYVIRVHDGTHYDVVKIWYSK
jgi:hypothetical protein